MPSLKRIETEVAALPDRELRMFSQWFAEFEAERWDQSLEAVVASGKLDDIAEEALAQYASGKCRAILAAVWEASTAG
ncbi:MAG: hypothetical protein A2075_02800 [Geobacteraceae bacterium GWC2_58_44]|nr:MAG: hypothetical protein A2075_02800 [Geobacteraceae bacterium GWC2_58_44]HBG05153.1 hypothetical protein [Geobacter sp.]